MDVTDPAKPRAVPGAGVRLTDAHGVSLARTYAYVAAGAPGVAIVDVERPEAPVLDRLYDAGGLINDARDVKVGMTNASLFAYVADGRNGLRVLQLTSPEETLVLSRASIDSGSSSVQPLSPETAARTEASRASSEVTIRMLFLISGMGLRRVLDARADAPKLYAFDPAGGSVGAGWRALGRGATQG